ncbi:hypothetical protein LCGC14_0882780 [marine sediment metagenome]|uniref:Uncharacterized protein n=1 Tax=marine sediment metagenome TaxID=412755 RepID=A0A0F9P1D1_9ZZZZ
MIRLSTVHGTKDVLLHYFGGEYCIIHEKLDNKLGYWLIKVKDMEDCIRCTEYAQNRNTCAQLTCPCGCECYCYKHLLPVYCMPFAIAYIPKSIMLKLIDEGFITISISDKEWHVQIALGTVPLYRPYMITGEAA